ncbi:MAG: hypothetical protein F6K30_07585 [Cyanothece sp. SIO2G6]|nr:hypothetical protein [Cyanothece sp. SIO2G6]
MNTELTPSLFDDLAPEVIATLDSMIIEAETMNLVDYRQEPYASGGVQDTVISLLDRGNPPIDHGTAQTTFSGVEGTYVIRLSFFDEEDGQGKIVFKHNDNEISEIVLDQDRPGRVPSEQNRRTETIATNVVLANGDTLTLEGFSDIEPRPGNPLYGEFSRIDYIELIKLPEPPVVPPINGVMAMEDGPEVVIDFDEQPELTYHIVEQPTNVIEKPEGNVRLVDRLAPVEPVPTPTEIITIEAEDLVLDGYAVDDRFEEIGAISLITRPNGQRAVYADQGTATGTFTGDAGTYAIEVGYYDESDGESQISFFLGDDTTQGPLDSWMLDDDEGAGVRPTEENFKVRTISNVSLQNGSAFVLQGVRDQRANQTEEGVRIDYVRFVPVGPPVLAQNLAFVFDPNPNVDFQDLGVGEERDVVFTYGAKDTFAQDSEPADVTVTVKGVNDAPVANDDTAETIEDNPVLIDVLGNDSDIDNTDITTSIPAIIDTFSVIKINGTDIAVGGAIALTSGATVTLNSNGILAYNPNNQFEYLPGGALATDQFTYTMNDGLGSEGKGLADTATVTVNIIGENDPAIIGTASGQVTEDDDPDGDTLLETSGVLTIEDPDIGEDQFQSAIINGIYGQFSIETAGHWTYSVSNQLEVVQSLNNGETLTEKFPVSSFDGTVKENAVTITINGVDDMDAIDDTAVIKEDVSPEPFTGNLLANDVNPLNGPGNELRITKIIGYGGVEYLPGQPIRGNTHF